MQSFLCKNCQFKQHQCYACGKLASSDKSANAEVGFYKLDFLIIDKHSFFKLATDFVDFNFLNDQKDFLLLFC